MGLSKVRRRARLLMTESLHHLSSARFPSKDANAKPTEACSASPYSKEGEHVALREGLRRLSWDCCRLLLHFMETSRASEGFRV